MVVEEQIFSGFRAGLYYPVNIGEMYALKVLNPTETGFRIYIHGVVYQAACMVSLSSAILGPPCEGQPFLFPCQQQCARSMDNGGRDAI